VHKLRLLLLQLLQLYLLLLLQCGNVERQLCRAGGHRGAAGRLWRQCLQAGQWLQLWELP
jgi:hypothetical protein